MTRVPRTLRSALLLGALLVTGAGAGTPDARGYGAAAGAGDTLRVRLVTTPARSARRGALALGAIVVGYLSPRGLPPVQGAFSVTDTGLVFRSAAGDFAAILPLVGSVRESVQGRWRAPAVALAYVDDALGRRAYLFRVDGGVFETDAPGTLLDVAAHPEWLEGLDSREWTNEPHLVGPADDAAARATIASIMDGGYADTLAGVFGRPHLPVGLVGARGRAAGRLGEYIASRDSLALDPAGMTSRAQLRHTLAHELAHRWQAQSSPQLALLWRDVPGIRDPKRYGHDNVSEQQAEAAAFAVHFLLTTAAGSSVNGGMAALEHYELLVPGTRILVRYFVLQPIFRGHPLRGQLTGTR